MKLLLDTQAALLPGAGQPRTVEGMKIVSGDAVFDRYDVPRVW